MQGKNTRIGSRVLGAVDCMFPNCKAGVALVAVLLLALTVTACGSYSPNRGRDLKGNPLVAITVGPLGGSPSIAVGGSIQLVAAGEYRHSDNSLSDEDLTSSVTWSSSNPAIATVKKGQVTGTGVGSTTIKAEFGGRAGSTTVFVGLDHFITVSPAGPLSLGGGSQEVDFHAIETFSDGSTLDVSGPATWTASPGGIIDIYPYLGGYATLVGTGKATLTATIEPGDAGSVEVTVVP